MLTYLHPLERNSWMLGLDLSASAERLLTLEHARDAGQFAISLPLAMTLDPPIAKDFLLMLPYYGEIEPENRALRQSEALSKELLQANQSLRRTDNDLQQFASVTSHDLQVPVSNIDLSVTLLENALSSRMTPLVRENIDQLRESSSRLHKLIEELQDFSRFDRENLKLDVMDLTQLFALVQGRLAPLIDEVEAVIDTGKLPQIHGVREQFAQLVTNLLSNAIKYRSPAGKLAVSVDARLVDHHWQISIADNGIGIEKRFHDKVFKPFQRLHQHENIVGTGLGLRICQEIVECHEGQIHIAASSDTGTTFVISLPASDQFAKQAA